MPSPFDGNAVYHRLVLDALPPGIHRALEFGCGSGRLARALRSRVACVTAIDSDRTILEHAQADDTERIEYLHGDFLTHPFEPASFDAVVSIAALHHMSSNRAFARTAEILKPGGTLALVGLAKSRHPKDLAMDLAGFVSRWVRHAGRRDSAQTRSTIAPPIVWPPPESYQEVRRKAERALPGVRYRRLLLFRYALLWTKPER